MTKDNAPEKDTPSTPTRRPATKRPFHVAARHLPRHVIAGIRALKRWDDLFDVSDEEVAAAVREFESIRIGG